MLAFLFVPELKELKARTPRRGPDMEHLAASVLLVATPVLYVFFSLLVKMSLPAWKLETDWRSKNGDRFGVPGKNPGPQQHIGFWFESRPPMEGPTLAMESLRVLRGVIGVVPGQIQRSPA